jgi:hypothetical protein
MGPAEGGRHHLHCRIRLSCRRVSPAIPLTCRERLQPEGCPAGPPRPELWFGSHGWDTSTADGGFLLVVSGDADAQYEDSKKAGLKRELTIRTQYLKRNLSIRGTGIPSAGTYCGTPASVGRLWHPWELKAQPRHPLNPWHRPS